MYKVCNPAHTLKTYLSQRLLHFRTGQESSLQFTPPCGLCVPATRWTGYRGLRIRCHKFSIKCEDFHSNFVLIGPISRDTIDIGDHGCAIHDTAHELVWQPHKIESRDRHTDTCEQVGVWLPHDMRVSGTTHF